MPTFSYIAINEQGREIAGVLDAVDSAAAKRSLENQNLLPLKVSPGKATVNAGTGKSGRKAESTTTGSHRRTTLRELIDFTRQLATLLRAGVQILSSLETLAQQTENLRFKEILTEITEDISGGEDFSAALGRHPKVFNQLYVNSVRAGEAGGVLDDILVRIADVMKRDLEIRQRVKGALRYPVIVVIGMIIAFLVMVTLVVPKFAGIFNQVELDLPLPTVILMFIADVVLGYWWIILPILVGIILLFRFFISTEKGRFWWDGQILKFPVFGPLILKAAITRFTAMFETLSRSGLPILQIFQIVSDSIGNVVLGEALSKASLGIEHGQEVSVSLGDTGFFPPMVIKMIAVGETSGALDEMLANISEYYDEEVKRSVDGLTAMIEPALTLGMGIMVLLLALAVFLPMWDMTQIAQQGF